MISANPTMQQSDLRCHDSATSIFWIDLFSFFCHLYFFKSFTEFLFFFFSFLKRNLFNSICCYEECVTSISPGNCCIFLNPVVVVGSHETCRYKDPIVQPQQSATKQIACTKEVSPDPMLQKYTAPIPTIVVRIRHLDLKWFGKWSPGWKNQKLPFKLRPKN